ncbi:MULTISPECIES: hypothetical protein [unclassified Novosphingobium]|uniref:hypothetical protein n=1 Tax=unclassified Novosphingobium TaxID=2644732 RepID=UPI00146B6E0F|nr:MULTISPECIES: hypothetical protein [unclassified Novosphingobium]NMN07394.1 hypothetical protein [Novosphingobium sp. SG919]NMN89699.1 hypothetical protein [Novosphingobium sp. SG916]
MHDFIGDLMQDALGDLACESGKAVHRRWGRTGCLLAALAILLVVGGGLWLLTR